MRVCEIMAEPWIGLDLAAYEGRRPVFLILLRAGAMGPNLVGAGSVILCDLWCKQPMERATDSAHRMGQKAWCRSFSSSSKVRLKNRRVHCNKNSEILWNAWYKQTTEGSED